MKKALDSLADILALVADILSSLALIVVIGTLLLQVIMRFVFKASFPWAEEISRYLMIWVVMLAASSLIKEDALIKVDFFDHLLPDGFKKVRDILFRVFLLVILAILLWQGVIQAHRGMNAYLSSVRLTMFWPYLALPVGTALMLIQFSILIIKDMLRKVKRDGVTS